MPDIQVLGRLDSDPPPRASRQAAIAVMLTRTRERSSSPGTSVNADFWFYFGLPGGTTNKNYYLCWIDVNDDTLATAKGNIYTYSDAASTPLPPM